jgi:glutamine amidotransferase
MEEDVLEKDKKVGVIEHGVGNAVAIHNLLRVLSVDTERIRNDQELKKFSQNSRTLILPGVGSFDSGMSYLREHGLDLGIQDFVKAGGKLLGICLGMQLLLDSSQEGVLPGLGLIRGGLTLMKSNADFRIPHVGWNTIYPTSPDPIFNGLSSFRFYHNHSYAAGEENPFAIAKIDYYDKYAIAVRKENVVGVQFHPEKSHSSGRKIIENFLAN